MENTSVRPKRPQWNAEKILCGHGRPYRQGCLGRGKEAIRAQNIQRGKKWEDIS